jgi:hypothetical protein
VALPLLLSGARVSRAEGAFLLAAYVAYVAMTITLATRGGSRDLALLNVTVVTGLAVMTAGVRLLLAEPERERGS